MADEPVRPIEITEAYVKSLSDPLVRYMGEPPHDPLTVCAIAVRAALYEAWEQVRHGELHLQMFPDGVGADMSHGEIMAGKRVICRVVEALKLMHPGPECAPGVRVLAARTAKYHTHRSLADAIGVDRAHVSRVERSKRNLTPDVAQRMAAVLDVTAAYLLTGVDAEPEPEPERDPQYLAAEALYGHPLQYALVGAHAKYVGNTENMMDAEITAASGWPEGLTVERYNRCPTCEEWSPCDRRKTDG